MKPQSIKVVIDNRSQLENALDEAVQDLSVQARENQLGILVTRTDPRNFVVALSPHVRFGTIQESTTW